MEEIKIRDEFIKTGAVTENLQIWFRTGLKRNM